MSTRALARHLRQSEPRTWGRSGGRWRRVPGGREGDAAGAADDGLPLRATRSRFRSHTSSPHAVLGPGHSRGFGVLKSALRRDDDRQMHAVLRGPSSRGASSRVVLLDVAGHLQSPGRVRLGKGKHSVSPLSDNGSARCPRLMNWAVWKTFSAARPESRTFPFSRRCSVRPLFGAQTSRRRRLSR